MRFKIFFTLLLFLAMAGIAEEWMTFTTDDGLAHNRCQAIAVDHDGIIWVASGDDPTLQGGVSSWDGETWTTYHSWTTDFGLRSNVVQDVFVDSHNNKWFAHGTIGSIGGVSKFDGETWTYFNLDSMTSIMAQWALCITEDSHGDIWVGGPAYLAHYCHGDWKFWDDDSISFFDGIIKEIKSYGDSIFICYLNGLTKISSSDTVRYEEFHGLRVNDIYIEENVKLITTNNGLYFYQDTIFHHYTTEDGLISNGVGAIHYIGPEEFWIGGGVNYFNHGEWSNARTDTSYPSITIIGIVGDFNGNIWLASCNGIWVFNHDRISWNVEEFIIKDSEKINVSPNPFRKECNLAESKDYVINILDIRGNLIGSIAQGSTNWIPKQSIPSGKYFLTSYKENLFEEVIYIK